MILEIIYTHNVPNYFTWKNIKKKQNLNQKKDNNVNNY